MENNLTFDRFHAVIDNAAEGVITINNQGQILSMNPAAESMFGYELNELSNKNIKILMPEPYKSEHDNYIANYIASRDPKIIGNGREVVGLRNNGEEFPMWLSVSEFNENNKQYFAGIIRDISEEKLILQKALDYQYLLEHSLNEIYIFDYDTLKFINVNRGALKNLQYSYTDIINKTPVDIKPDYTKEKFQEIILPLKNSEVDKITFKTRHQRKDGTIYPVEVHLELMEYDYKVVFVAVILDITERALAEEKARINEEKLAHTDRVSIFGEMTAGIAHEINQPLTAISAYASAGLRRIDSENFNIDKFKELFEKISAATQRTTDVISHLKMMLKPMSRRMDSVDINVIINDALDLIKIDSRADGYEFKLNLADELPLALGDTVNLQQVILNLVRNSIDASIDSDLYNNKIIISSEEVVGKNMIKVSVKDFGCGIDPEIAGNLFAPFHTTKESGIGIGLSICQSIIQLHKGRIWVTNNNDKGVTFHFTVQTTLGE